MKKPEVVPYYLPRWQVRELQQEYNVLPKELEPGYRDVETESAYAYLEQFGDHLTLAQERYLLSNQIIFPNLEGAKRVYKITDADTPTHPDQLIDGVAYDSYSVPSALTYAAQVWAGRLIVYPLRRWEMLEVNPDHLGIKGIVKAKRTIRPKPQHFHDTPYCHTNELASVGMHEYTHGIQDWRLPTPLLEGHAVYCERVVVGQNGWHYHGRDNLDYLGDLFADCVRWFGKPLHRLMFGNYETSRRAKLLRDIKSVFTSREVDRLSRKGRKDRHVVWKKKIVDRQAFAEAA